MPLPTDFLIKSRGKARSHAKPKRKSMQPSRKARPSGKVAPVGSRERTLKLMKASVASSKTPEHLRKALRKKIKEMGG